MNRLSIKTKIITGLITGGVLISSAGYVFASTNSSTITSGKTISTKVADKGVKLESELKAAVKSNVITQAESDKILAYETSKVPTGVKPEKGVKPDLFKELVDKKILTQVKADALKTFQEAQRTAQRQSDLKTRINGFVTNNTITQSQATKIIAAMNADEVNKRATRDKASTITQTQADKLASVSHKGPGHGGKIR